MYRNFLIGQLRTLVKKLKHPLCVSLVLLSPCCALGLGAQELLVGSLPGEVQVDNTGSAKYTIPLAVPVGTGGIEPELSLEYSSQGGNGPLGVGWSLGGFR